MFPYHIDSLLQLSEVCKANGDAAMGAELIGIFFALFNNLERALYSFEKTFHPMFNLSTGTSRLDFDRVENRSLFLALFRHVDVIARKGCWRTAFEFQKLLSRYWRVLLRETYNQP